MQWPVQQMNTCCDSGKHEVGWDGALWCKVDVGLSWLTARYNVARCSVVLGVAVDSKQSPGMAIGEPYTNSAGLQPKSSFTVVWRPSGKWSNQFGLMCLVFSASLRRQCICSIRPFGRDADVQAIASVLKEEGTQTSCAQKERRIHCGSPSLLDLLL